MSDTTVSLALGTSTATRKSSARTVAAATISRDPAATEMAELDSDALDEQLESAASSDDSYKPGLEEEEESEEDGLDDVADDLLAAQLQSEVSDARHYRLR